LKIPGARAVDEVIAPPYGAECPDLFALVGRAERALAEGHAAEEARAIVAALRSAGTCPAVLEALADGIKHKQAEAALERLAAGQSPPGSPGAPPTILARCTLLPSLVEELSFAVSRGAPRFDAGHPDVCLDIYRTTARAVIARYGAHGRC